MTIEGIPDGWEPVRFDYPIKGESFLNGRGEIILHIYDTPSPRKRLIIRKIEKPKRYRPFANAAEYVANRREGFAVDWNIKKDRAPGFFAVVSANDSFLWVAFGDAITRFDWVNAFEKLQFRHVDNSTSPFGIEVTE